MENTVQIATTLYKMKIGTIEVPTFWEFYVLFIYPLIIAACCYIVGHHEGSVAILRTVSNIKRQDGMGFLDDYFDLYQLDPIEIRYEPKAMFDPPLKGLDGVRQSLLATEWKPPLQKYDALQQYMWTIRQPMRRLHDYRHPDSRYKFHDLHPPAEMENFIRSGPLATGPHYYRR